MRLALFQLVCVALDVFILITLRRRPPRMLARVASAVLALFVLPFSAAHWVFRGEMPPFAFMQLACWVLFVHAPLVLLVVAALVRETRTRVITILLAVALAFVGIDAFFVEPHALVTRRYEIESAAITRPVRIVVLSDIQTDSVGAYERRAIARAMAERPTLILFPGDYIQLPLGPERDRQTALLGAALANVDAPLGAHAVEGNVDPRERWQRIFEGTRVRTYIDTTHVAYPDLTVTALSFRDSFDASLRIAHATGFHVVFGHGPDFALGDVRADLLIAGHTHGGQVALPFFGPPITLTHVPRSWAGGLTHLTGGRTLVVSRGVGMERGPAPRLRFLCPPEIVVIDVRPKPTR